MERRDLDAQAATLPGAPHQTRLKVIVVPASQRVRELGIQLPEPAQPMANYVRARRVGNLLFVAGHGPAPAPDGTRLAGKVGRDLTLEQAYQAARLTGINLLASVQAELGDLDRVTQVVKVLGMVNCAPGFNQTPRVING